MLTFEVTEVADLERVTHALHDALFDRDKLVHDAVVGTLTLPFDQEAGQFTDGRDYELVEKGWISDRYRVPFVRCKLTIPRRGEWRNAGSRY